jgi:hypothetical protein
MITLKIIFLTLINRTTLGSKDADYNDIKQMMTYSSYAKIQAGRYFVALSLHEAEALRGVLHMRKNTPLVDRADCAVRYFSFV